MACAEHLLGVGHDARHLSVCALSNSVRLGLLLSHLWDELEDLQRQDVSRQRFAC